MSANELQLQASFVLTKHMMIYLLNPMQKGKIFKNIHNYVATNFVSKLFVGGNGKFYTS